MIFLNHCLNNSYNKVYIIYDYIYDNIVDACVEAIENGNYEFAYNRYKESILSLEQTFLKPTLQSKLIRTLKQQTEKKV